MHTTLGCKLKAGSLPTDRVDCEVHFLPQVFVKIRRFSGTPEDVEGPGLLPGPPD